MPFLNNVPQPNDRLKNSQGQLLGNNAQLDNSFAVDHFTYSNLTANNGKHNQVTTPLITGSAHPTTAANEPKFYGMQDSTNLGVIQYSRGPSDAVPTPVTSKHSTDAVVVIGGNSSIPIFDFSGLTMAFCTLYASSDIFFDRRVASVMWIAPAGLAATSIVGSGTLAATVSSPILSLKNSSSVAKNVYWTLEFHRVA